MTTNVLITGGAGFLGRGILRRAEREAWDWNITVYSRDEQKQNEARRRYPHARFVLGDVCDTERLTAVAAGHGVIIHAAAVKYIPEAEENPGECVRVNIDGARSVITAAARAGVSHVVGISTDKAVRPLNVYGKTKATMEHLFAEASYRQPATWFDTVRYGNVVGSTGSVIPLFQHQLRRDGFVTLTVPTMTRFWMPIDEAIDCVLFAMQPGHTPGSVIVPRPRSMRMGDLAATLAGERVKIIGPRPGEKEHEELMHATESARMEVLAKGAYYGLVSRAFASEHQVGEPMTLASHSPAGGWVTPAQMLAWIEDAANV